ncbi:MAG: hypothetical protein ACOYKA_06295 [Legionellaceae bacterium]
MPFRKVFNLGRTMLTAKTAATQNLHLKTTMTSIKSYDPKRGIQRNPPVIRQDLSLQPLSTEPSRREKMKQRWDTIWTWDFGLLVSATSAFVTLVKGPFDKAVTSIARNMSFLPAKGTPMIQYLQAMYRGSHIGFGFGMLRTAIMPAKTTTVKVALSVKTEAGMAALDKTSGAQQTSVEKAGMIVAGSTVETLMGQLPANLAEATNIAGQKIKASVGNYKQLFKAGLGCAFSASLVNLACITQLQDFFKSRISSQYNWKGILSGALAGACSAVIAYPISHVKQKVMNTFNLVDGKITFGTTESVTARTMIKGFKDETKAIREARGLTSFKTQLSKVFGQMCKEHGLSMITRMGKSAGVFAAVIVALNSLGTNPYTDLKHYFSGDEGPKAPSGPR